MPTIIFYAMLRLRAGTALGIRPFFTTTCAAAAVVLDDDDNAREGDRHSRGESTSIYSIRRFSIVIVVIKVLTTKQA